MVFSGYTTSSSSFTLGFKQCLVFTTSFTLRIRINRISQVSNCFGRCHLRRPQRFDPDSAFVHLNGLNGFRMGVRCWPSAVRWRWHPEIPKELTKHAPCTHMYMYVHIQHRFCIIVGKTRINHPPVITINGYKWVVLNHSQMGGLLWFYPHYIHVPNTKTSIQQT